MHIIIDSSALAHAARYATGDLAYQSAATGVMYGFCRQILTLSDTFQSANFIFCWDGRDYLRRQKYPDYKKSRSQEKMTPQEKKELELAYQQFEKLHGEILPALGFRNNFRVTGYEADDIIAYIVKEYDSNFVVVSSDQDLYQLLDYCKMYLQKKKQFYTKRHFIEEFGMEPSRWAEVKAIAGCNTDNVEGIRGIGEKTAAKYICGSLKETTEAFRKISEQYAAIDLYNLSQDEEKVLPMILRNRELVTLPMDGFPGVDLVSDVITSFSDFESVCHRFGFKSFLQGKLSDEWYAFLQRRGQ